uniref:VWFA domain-containing protein n=1 Tax=Astyanax mexicanus TaxID=7994 RepID=A0A8B9GR90_ASTMX
YMKVQTDVLHVWVHIRPTMVFISFCSFLYQDMITSGSQYLFHAVEDKVFFKEVKILVPPTWKGNYERAKRETYDKASVFIDRPNPIFGDEPYTKQMKGCGEEGEYIHFTPDFLLDDDLLDAYGTREKVFVHEWAHLRWGVFDEYSEEEPFYLFGNNIEPTRCIKDIRGRNYKVTNGKHVHCPTDVATGLPIKGCQFFPDREQENSASIMYMQSLDSVKAFCGFMDHNYEAPNMQNKKCDYRSTSSVIFESSVDSDALNTLQPLPSPPPPPTFTVIQRQHRVICLILDVSGSMKGERILRLQQAATLFLSEIVEEGAQVGIVKFSTNAEIVSPLTTLQGKESRDGLIRHLPKTVDGSTNMCNGLNLGFEVLKKDDGSTKGDDLIFLTDGEATDKVEDCLQSVVDSGAIVNTIALGPSASSVLITMANLTNGKFIVADQSLLSNQLVDAFTSFILSDGDPTKQAIQSLSLISLFSKQLVSIGKNTADWFNGTVPIDRTVGNGTTFTVIYEKSIPTVHIEAPSGRVYNQAHVTNHQETRTITLNIPGTAEPGDWKYSFLNIRAAAQTMSLTVTSRAAHDDVNPIIVTAEMNQPSADGSKPMVVYAEVKQNRMPVLGAKVMATMESDTGHSELLHLLDNGAGADTLKDDGVYSRYFTKLKNGRYSLKVQVTREGGNIPFTPSRQGGSLYVPGYIVDGELQLNPPKPPVNVQPADVGSFTRIATGESFVVSVPPNAPPPNFPPNKVTDLSAEILEDTVLLNWTAPGEDLDQGTAGSYEIKWSEDLEVLQKNFSGANVLNTSALQPQEAGSSEQHHFLPDIPIPNGTTLFFALRSEDKEAVKSDVSNIARVKKFVPGPTSTETPDPGLNMSAVVISVCVGTLVVCLIAAVAIYVKKRQRNSGVI